MMKFLITLLVFSVWTPIFAFEHNNKIDLEYGSAWQSYNKFQIPNDSSASRVDLANLDDGAFQAYRISYSRYFASKHELRLLLAPLHLKFEGHYPTDINFQGKSFSKNDRTSFDYSFNSYRLSYLYHLNSTNSLKYYFGFTGKIRAAEIRLQAPGISASKKNIGFVPLLSFGFSYNPDFAKFMELAIDADALAAPQGRAEDISLKLKYLANEMSSFYLGYRILEGGADNKEVYTFSLFHYAILGINIIW